MRTLLLWDNQAVTRAGVTWFCTRDACFTDIREVGDRRGLVEALVACPDAAVLLDYALSDLRGADDLLILQARFPRAVWLLFSDELSEDFIRRTLGSSEAFGLLMKDASAAEIRSALAALAFGRRFITSRVESMLRTTWSLREEKREEGTPKLTGTEKEILKAIASGQTTKEIAAERFSSVHTITTHRKHIFRKLGINNVQEAVRYAFRAGLLDATDYSI